MLRKERHFSFEQARYQRVTSGLFGRKMPTYPVFGGWVISIIADWFEVIADTFVNLSPGQVWKAPHNVIDAGTVNDRTDHVVHPNPSALHNRIAPADIGHIDQVT